MDKYNIEGQAQHDFSETKSWPAVSNQDLAATSLGSGSWLPVGWGGEMDKTRGLR